MQHGTIEGIDYTIMLSDLTLAGTYHMEIGHDANCGWTITDDSVRHGKIEIKRDELLRDLIEHGKTCQEW